MKTINEKVDVVVAGGGTAGHVAAIQAARAGIMTSVIEAGTMLGGTMTAF
jgi:pyruvate/2-oxoglutarate dehydrogenase complex dihydrolipoamide dehydrogenase (E3) component